MLSGRGKPHPTLSQRLPGRAHPSPISECGLPLGILLALPQAAGDLPLLALRWKAQGQDLYLMRCPELRTEQAEGERSDFSGPEEARKSKLLFLQQKAPYQSLSPGSQILIHAIPHQNQKERMSSLLLQRCPQETTRPPRNPRLPPVPAKF